MTLPELMVSMVVAALVLSAFLTIMVAAQKDIIHQQNRSQTNDQARVAIEQIDRELRSGTYVADPTNEGTCCSPSVAYYGMHFQTQANGNTRGGLTCVQYRISSDQLLRRSWPSGNPGAVSGWWTVSDAVVNADLTPAVPAFQLDSSSAQGGGTALGSRLVNIVLVMNAKTSDGPNVQIQDSIEIRNQTSVSGDPCTPPAG